MRVDTHVTGCTRQRFPFPVWNVLLRFRISVLLRHTEVDYVYDIRSFGVRPSNEEVVGFNVSVDQVLLMNCLDSGELNTR